MMKCIERLLDSERDLTVGNHSVCLYSWGRQFFYHHNCVCQVDDEQKTFELDDCGYEGFPSTTRTLNDYRRYFLSQGYEEIGGNL